MSPSIKRTIVFILMMRLHVFMAITFKKTQNYCNRDKKSETEISTIIIIQLDERDSKHRNYGCEKRWKKAIDDDWANFKFSTHLLHDLLALLCLRSAALDIKLVAFSNVLTHLFPCNLIYAHFILSTSVAFFDRRIF